MSPNLNGYPGKSVTDQEEGPLATFGGKSALFIGAFGYWWSWDDGLNEDSDAVKDRLASSVMAMESLDTDEKSKTCHGGDESPNYSDREDIALPGDIRRYTRHNKHCEQKLVHRKVSPAVHSHAESRSVHPAPLLNNSHSTTEEPVLLAALAEKKLSHIVDQITEASATSVEKSQPDPKEIEREKQRKDALQKLQTQIEKEKTSAAEVQDQLQTDLDNLRHQKKEDDRQRSEAKARTKVLEEAKRIAEIDRAEFDKRQLAAKQNRQTVLEKIDRLKAESARLERKSHDHDRKTKQTSIELSQKIEAVKTEIQQKKEIVAKAEKDLRETTTRVEDLEGAIEEKKNELLLRRQQAHHAWQQQQQQQPRAVSNPQPIYYAVADPNQGQWMSNGDMMAPGQTYLQPVSSSSDLAGYALARAETLPTNTSFIEHRLWHQNREKEPLNALDALYPSSLPVSRFASRESLHEHPSSNFAPFGPDRSHPTENSLAPAQAESNSPHQTQARSLALPFFMHGSLTSLTGDEEGKNGNVNLDSGPFSPMTPSQASLLPSQLFDLLDDDDDEVANLPLSPTRRLESAVDFPITPRPENTSKPSTSPHSLPGVSPSQQASLDHIAAGWTHLDDTARHLQSLNPSAKAFNFTLPAAPSQTRPEANKEIRDIWADTAV